MKEEKKILFTLNGLEVREGSTYIVKDKPDGDAPSGFVKAGVSKLPSDGVDESFQVRFESINGKQGVWDTGFYVYSPCYKGLPDADKKAIVQKLVKDVLTPYRAASGIKDAFDEANEEFFKNTNFKVFTGLVYNTDNPVDLMNLYFALRTYQVAPQGAHGDSKYRECSYILVDTTKNVKEKDKRNIAQFEAVGLFQTLFENDREKLISILHWLNFRVAANPDKYTLITMFQEYVSGSYDKAQTFLNLADDASTALGLDKISIYRRLKEVLNKSNKITKSPKGVLFYDGDIELGPDLKAAAENIAKNKDLKRVKNEVLLSEDSEL